MFLIMVLLAVVLVQAYDTSRFSLNSTNLVTNANFAQPDLNGNRKYGHMYAITGWLCSNYCELHDVALECAYQSLSCPNNYSQVIDLDNFGYFEFVSQNVTVVEAG